MSTDNLFECIKCNMKMINKKYVIRHHEDSLRHKKNCGENIEKQVYFCAICNRNICFNKLGTHMRSASHKNHISMVIPNEVKKKNLMSRIKYELIRRKLIGQASNELIATFCEGNYDNENALDVFLSQLTIGLRSSDSKSSAQASPQQTESL